MDRGKEFTAEIAESAEKRLKKILATDPHRRTQTIKKRLKLKGKYLPQTHADTRGQ